MRICNGCGRVVDTSLGANRRPFHGGVTNAYGSTQVWCWDQMGWQTLREMQEPQPVDPEHVKPDADHPQM